MIKRNIIKQALWGERLSLRRSEAEQLRYLPQSVKLEEAVNPHLIRITMLVVSAGVLIFILWTALTNINEVARADGEVVPHGFVQVVQHLDGGIVMEILTEEGAAVKEGDVLVRIDDGGTRQDLAEIKARQAGLKMQAERLSAFVEGREPDFSVFENTSAKSEIAQQRRVFGSMLEARQKEGRITEDKLTQKEKKIATLEAQQNSLKAKLGMAHEALDMQEKLLKDGYASKLTVLNYRKEENEISSDLTKIGNDIKQAADEITEQKSRLASVEARHRDETYEKLARVESEIAQNQEIQTKLENKVARLQVRAPVAGLIKGLELNTVGGIVEPGKTLMEIIPSDRTLVIEARISPRDIGHVQIGQKVKIKVSSYDFSRYGAVDGTLEFVSAATFPDEHGRPYYRARITLAQHYIGSVEGQNIIMPGMTVEADIVTGEKSVLAYLLKPIHLSLRTAMTER